LRFYRSCWAVFWVFKFFGSFLEPRRPPSDPALHSRMTALGGGEAPFFAVAQRSSGWVKQKKRAVLRSSFGRSDALLRMQQPRGQRRKAVGRTRRSRSPPLCLAGAAQKGSREG